MTEWIEWNGGECPVPYNTNVMVKFRNSEESTKVHIAEAWRWEHDQLDYDVVAYRVIGDLPVKLEDDASEDVAKWSLDTLTAQCLALPQADREALIEALQKPVRDWADDVWEAACESANDARLISQDKAAAAVIRTMCRPKKENKQ